ncbi:xylanase inhibitor protein 2-like [Oryza glaberrima]|uniref:xylanase inhibitor protein 2-like n=1 Tax=Oryza glaberrima TaxID=4538 RepID=UPI00224C0892|nr:xylanase inhibitor protein 2-like [Oryza glaberrima]
MIMAFGRRRSLFFPVGVAAILLLAAGHATAVNTGETVVFWGRNKDEGSLREACDTGLYTSVIISFLAVFGHGRYSLDLSGHDVSAVGADIKHCQSKYIPVLLSIGGQGGDYSLPTNASAADVADHLWDSFLGGGRAGVPRPFGDAVVDGVDLFIDQGGAEHYDELARQLFSHYKFEMLLTATTRCSYPDHRLDMALATGLFTHIHVRVFGGDAGCTTHHRASWERWAAAYPGSLVYLGVVASPEQDANAYLPRKALFSDVLSHIVEKPNYGGLMIWDRYYDKKTGYSAGKAL